MTEESADRIKKILEMQSKFEGTVVKSESSLFELILEYWETLRTNPAMFKRLWKRFAEESYSPLFTTFITDIKTVLALNEEYFAATDIATSTRIKEIAKITNDHIFERLGVESSGKVIEGGYMDTLVQDQTAKRKIQQFFHRTKALKNDTQLRVEMKTLVKGVDKKAGIIDNTFKNYAYDTYQEADRLAQNDFADKLKMPAAIYTGGVIEGSRPFCIERNRKVFLREEIALFGTPLDKYEGYSDKKNGMFAGKPKDGYDPLSQCGGFACRHHWSWVSKEYAVRIDKTLQIVEGKLVRKEE